MEVTFKKSQSGSIFVVFRCPECRSVLRSIAEAIGDSVKCSNCNHEFAIPGKTEYAQLINNLTVNKGSLIDSAAISQSRITTEQLVNKPTVKKLTPPPLGSSDGPRRNDASPLNSDSVTEIIPENLFQIRSSVSSTRSFVELLEYSALKGTGVTPRTLEFILLADKLGVAVRQIRINLQDSSCQIQAGALQFMRGTIDIENDVKGVGGFFKNSFRAIATGESLMKPRYSGTGQIYCEPTYCHFLIGRLDNEEMIINDGLFYAVESSISIETISLGATFTGAFGGQGFFQSKLKGSGWYVLELPVPENEIIKYRLRGNGDTLKVDGTFGLLRKGNVQFKVEKSTKSLIGSSLSGEGILQTYTGHGEVWLAPTKDIYSALEIAVANTSTQTSNVISKPENAISSALKAFGALSD